jgi:hypothetical protein
MAANLTLANLPTLCTDHSYSAELTGHILALAVQLTPAQLGALGTIIGGLDNEAFDRARHEGEAEMARTLAHFPGLAPAWRVVFNHLDGVDDGSPCTQWTGRDKPLCTLPTESLW